MPGQLGKQAATELHPAEPADGTAPVDETSAAIESVIARFGRLLRATAARSGLQPSELDEAVQDVRLRLWNALRTSENIRAVTPFYMQRTAISVVVDILRRRRSITSRARSTEGELLDLAAPSRDGADAALLRGESEVVLAAALEEVLDSRRAVVRMHLAGYDRDEIARLLGWSEAKTRNLLYRGLGELRAALDRRGHSPGARS